MQIVLLKSVIAEAQRVRRPFQLSIMEENVYQSVGLVKVQGVCWLSLVIQARCTG